jgi:outer membrane protein assembly factor BamB/tetratricopeptide (TPR) repeat protein
MMTFRPVPAGDSTRKALAFATSLALLTLVTSAPAQGPNRTATKFYPDFSDTADALLRNAASHARDGQWAEAVDIYQRVILQFGDKVAKLPRDDEASDPSGESMLYVDLRQFCQRRLAALPPEARAIYRRRVDAQAEGWFRQGSAQRDRSALRRVVEQAFCSSWGDDALDLLGDLAFEDGRFDEALSMYRQLVPDRADDHTGLIYPDATVDLARVAAKKVLCRAALGEPAPGPADLEAYARRFPNGKGSLAGRDGPYVKSLAEALKADHLAPPAQSDGRWPTFAGSPTRTKVVPGSIDVGSLQWRVPLPVYDPSKRVHGINFRPGMGMSSMKIAEDRILCYHPIVLGDQVVVNTESKILAYNLNDRPEGSGPGSGAVNPVWEAPPDNPETTVAAASPISAIPRYTLTAHGDRIYARLGPTSFPIMGMGRMGSGSPSQSKIIAVDRSTEGKVLWSKLAGEITLPKQPADATNRTGFEGTPVADSQNVFVAMTDRREQTSTYVVCLDAETGNPRWVRYLGAASADGDNMMGFAMGMGMGMASAAHDFGHRLLSLDGPTLYYQTNLGALAALDAETGGIRWVATYPRQDRAEGGPGNDRDLNPAIVHDGMVIIAPDDSNRIYAFDAGSGRLLWKSDALPNEVKLAHLLGVAKGRLVATGDLVLLFDVKDGKLLTRWPDSGNAYEGYGRGLLAGDRIYWPTRNEIHILDQATGLRAEPSIKLRESFQTTGGNLAVGDGYLIVAQTDALVVFCQNSRLIQRYRDEIAHNPDQSMPYFRLAQAAEATGQDELALESLTLALARVRPAETIDGVALGDVARDHQYRLLMRLGTRARSAKRWEESARHFEGAVRAARGDRDRLAAQLLLADVQIDRGAPRGAVAIFQRLLGDERLRHLSVAAEDGHRTVRADLLIADRLAALIRTNGRELYREFDAAARRLLDEGKEEQSPRLLEEVSRAYPVAEVVPDSLLALGRLFESLQRPVDAAYAYKRLVTSAHSDGFRARALLGLARAYEEQHLWVPARDTYTQALARFGSVPLEELGPDTRLGSLISERLSSAPFNKMTGDRSEPRLPVPLVRRWGRPLADSVHALPAAGVPPSTEASRFFLVEGTELRAIQPATGATAWSVDLEAVPTWVGYLADKIVAATDSRIVSLSLDRGTIGWSYALMGAGHDRAGTNPFARGDAEPAAADAAAKRFHGFQIVGNRLVCLRGDSEILALDGDRGLVDWSYAPASGTINPLVWIGPRRIVLQTRKPGTIQVIDTATGRRRAEFPQAGDVDWLRAPLAIDDDHLAIVPDKLTVALLDLRRGGYSWVFHESRQLPKNGAPVLLGDAERLLVIHDGTELIRLDPATGTKKWSRPLGAEDLSDRSEAFALDGDRFYWTSARALKAVSLDDGSLAWSRHLTGPESVWTLGLTDHCVMAYPLFSTPTPGEQEGLPLVFLRRNDGALVQRLLFPVAIAEVAVRLSPQGALVATQSGLWALGERKPVDQSKPSP